VFGGISVTQWKVVRPEEANQGVVLAGRALHGERVADTCKRMTSGGAA
jgi:hypothetical protein